MKKTFTAVLLYFVTLLANAQYKKASFFTRSGRFYGVGATGYFMGDGKGSPIGIFITTGKEGEKRFIRWAEYTFIPAYNFSYTTIDKSITQGNNKVTVTGKSNFLFNYNLNFGWYVTDKNDDDSKLNFYPSFGISILFAGGISKSNIQEYDEPEKKPETDAGSFGGRLGGGLTYQFTPTIGLKADAAYNVQWNFQSDDKDVYYIYTSHPYISVGVRFMFRNED